MTITRFAPSPTGYLHIGGARTALFCYLFAKHTGGKFLLRIEDTDRARSTPEATQAILNSLEWLGLHWDDEAVYQFARQHRHVEIAKQLVSEGKAYYCYTSQEELDAFREANPHAKFQSSWRDGGAPPDGATAVIRLKAPLEGSISITDHVRGTVSVEAKELDDMVLLRADGTPTYMLAVVVDDHDMNITHVIRGDDHFTNSFRQVMLYQAMGWTVPEFAHIPLIHGADGAKLSKRHGALGVEAYREMGFLPEALRNYLLRLGWSHGDDEIISDEQAIAWFTLDGLGHSPSRLDMEKLKSLNAHYMKEADPARLAELIHMPQLPLSAMPWLVERAQTLIELKEQAEFLTASRPLAYTEKAASLLSEAKDWIFEAHAAFASIDDWKEESIKEAGQAFMHGKSFKPKQFMPVIRASLSGKEASAGTIYQIMEALGKEETLARLNDCC